VISKVNWLKPIGEPPKIACTSSIMVLSRKCPSKRLIDTLSVGMSRQRSPRSSRTCCIMLMVIGIARSVASA